MSDALPDSASVRWPAGWQGANVVFFDCDSTLSTLEGIDELGVRRGVDVAELTRRSMAGEIPLDDVYAERLALVQPTADDLDWLAGRYAETEVSGAGETVRALEAIGIECRVISGGLLPAVLPFAERLGFQRDRVHAVDFDPGAPEGIAAAAREPLARKGGKPEVVAGVCVAAGHESGRMLVGDGASDLEAAAGLDLFVGFGGVEARKEIRDASPVYVSASDLAPIAVLACGPSKWNDLAATAPKLLIRGVKSLSEPGLFHLR